jgi:threonine/homoserine/homoserine lactone efflux protein
VGALLVTIVPLALAASLNPAMIGTTLTLLLSANRPLERAIAFTIGAAALCVVVSVAAAAGLNNISQVRPLHRSGGVGPAVFAIGGGVILLITAIEALRGARPPRPARTSEAKRSLGKAAPRPAVALALGAGLMLSNLKSLALLIVAVQAILAAQVGTVLNLVFVGGFIIVMLGVMEVAILIYVADRERAATTLTAVRTWLERHARALVLLIGALVGLYLLARGITGLIS